MKIERMNGSINLSIGASMASERRMARFVKVATLESLAATGALEVEQDGVILALFRHGGDVIALDGVCPHQGGPLASGDVSGTTLTCPWHGWQFDVTTGRCLTTPSVAQPRYSVRLDGPDILVELP
jgi:nitrite reductase/ring-hydroxylating ferredoxin subunit